MKNYLLTLIILFQATFLIKAQTAPIKWELVYDPVPSMGRDVELTTDNCYVVTSTYDYVDGFTLKIDPYGKIIWVKPYAGGSIKQTNDNGFIIANCNHAGLYKLNQSGNCEWFYKYGGIAQDDFNSVIQASDHGFVACGFSKNFGDSSLFIVKTDSSGKFLWKRSLCSSINANADDLIEIDKNYYVVGNVEESYAHYKIVINKLSPGGNLIWQKMYDVGFLADEIIQTEDNNLIIMGFHSILKLTLNGDIIWQKSLSDAWRFYSIKQTADLGFILAGYIGYNENEGYQSNLIIKTDSAGELIWSKIYFALTDNYNDNFESVQPTSDNGFIACGWSDYDDITKLRIIKADSSGNCITGFNISYQDNDCNIYPNPTNGKIIIDSKDIRKIEIIDLKGNTIFSREGNIQQADISNEPYGIYFLILTKVDGIVIEKIVKE
jgi:hypothetical protein